MTDPHLTTRWISCQLGAREHFAVPRALHRQGALEALITDAWAAPGSPWSMVPGMTGQRLSERYAADLAGATVADFTVSLLWHEASWRLRGLAGWRLILERNQWFQQRAAAWLARLPSSQSLTVFAHSYSALEIFRAAKARGFSVVLGQIDPGEGHVQIVRQLSERWPEFGPPPEEPPPEYFSGWREECHLADRIIVNSAWSRDRLERVGVGAAKIEVIALPYEAEPQTPPFERMYPSAFTPARPLRALFVGSIATFKGVPSLLESIALLGDAPIELRMVGPLAASIPARFSHDRRIRWIGSVSRSEVMDYCRGSDVLVFPSHSDGFGMAQVEAQEWRLPVIASRSSGRVVEDGVNGLLLPEVSATAIAAALSRLLDPALLSALSRGARTMGMTLDAFGAALLTQPCHH